MLTSAPSLQVVSRWTGIPVDRLQQTEVEKLLHLKEELHKRVVGQQRAVAAVADAVLRSRAGLASRNRGSSFLFLVSTPYPSHQPVFAMLHRHAFRGLPRLKRVPSTPVALVSLYKPSTTPDHAKICVYAGPDRRRQD